MILNSVFSFTLSPQEMYANEVSLPVYILTSDIHDIHTNAVFYLEKKIIREAKNLCRLKENV